MIDDLARRLEVSAIPVREALQLLQSEGLVLMVPHVGATVAPISRESDRGGLHGHGGAGDAWPRAPRPSAPTPEDLDALEEIVALMDRALATDAHDQWADLNTRFHATISRLTAMPMLQEMMERVLDRWDRVRRYFFSGVLVHRAQQAQREHHALLDAMRRRRTWVRLEETIRDHNRGALADYTAFLESRLVPAATKAER